MSGHEGANARGGGASRARVALSTASVYPETCADAFAMAARLGYDGVEVMVWTDPISQDPAALARLSLHYDVPVLAVHAPTLLVTQRVWGREPWGKLERACAMATALGAGTVVVHPPFLWQREYAARFVSGLAELEQRHQVRLAVENMYPWRAGTRAVQAYLPGWDPVPQPYTHVTLDLSHAAVAGTDPHQMAVALGPRLAHLHLSDSLGSTRDEHLVPGRGDLPCASVLAMLGEAGFDGTVVVEINTRRVASRDEREQDLAESLAFARQHLRTAGPSDAVDPLTGPLPAFPVDPLTDPLPIVVLDAPGVTDLRAPAHAAPEPGAAGVDAAGVDAAGADAAGVDAVGTGSAHGSLPGTRTQTSGRRRARAAVDALPGHHGPLLDLSPRHPVGAPAGRWWEKL